MKLQIVRSAVEVAKGMTKLTSWHWWALFVWAFSDRDSHATPYAPPTRIGRAHRISRPHTIKRTPRAGTGPKFVMDPSRGSFATHEARLDTFAAPKTKSRRPSARGKKSAPKPGIKGGWPLESPRPHDLAWAGFIFKPTSASPDNVQCFHCQTQLDGWEPNDVPAFEHLTHSPDCGFAINVCIRIRDGDPGRIEDDPLSENMSKARRETFQDLWPLDVSAGYPSIDQVRFSC